MATRKNAGQDEAVAHAFAPAVLELVREIPRAQVRKRREPEAAARELAGAAALKAALAAGSLALPGGVLGWLAVLPQLRTVWRIQVQLVVDIAALHGHRGRPTRDEILHCLFQHATARTVQQVATRAGAGLPAGSIPGRVLQLVARRVAVRLVRRVAGRRWARLLPLVGAVGIGAYAYLETARVGTAAMALFGPGERTQPGRPSMRGRPNQLP